MNPVTNLNRILIGLLAFFGVFAAEGEAVAEKKPQVFAFCSMINLIATPEKFDGKRVRTEGVATIGFEQNAIYISTESARQGAGVNGIRLSVAPTVWKERASSLHLKWVLVEGVYHQAESGETHWRGYIDDITLLYSPSDVESSH